MNPINSEELKSENENLFNVNSILENLAIYSLVGLAGSLVTFLAMLFPYPLMYV